ncbi:MAG: Diguanylate cyclase DosC [Stenotrophomonas maltophilia]|nr:MAG: Diguanylate cyclase DosC [Stenotrophomonas maltophilia]
MPQPLTSRLRPLFSVSRALARASARENLKRLAWLALLAIPFDLLHIVMFGFSVSADSGVHLAWRREVIVIHFVAALLFGVLGLSALHLRRHHQHLPNWVTETLVLLAGGTLLAFGLGIAAADQQVTSSVTPFLMGAVATALILMLRPVCAMLLYGLAAVAFNQVMQQAQPDAALRLSNQMSGLTICGIGLLLALILWTGFARQLQQRLRLRRQRRALEEKNRQLAYLAGHDPLTGLLNRREFDQVMKQELARSSRNGLPLALLMVDLDHFKDVNDRHGHPLGDEVIRHTATLLRKHTRAHDSVARLGGEEFLLLIPEVTPAQASALAEKLRRLIQDTPLPMKSGLLYLTASFGIATLDGGVGSSYENLYSTADQALYRAKASGRNRLEVADAAPYGTLE